MFVLIYSFLSVHKSVHPQTGGSLIHRGTADRDCKVLHTSPLLGIIGWSLRTISISRQIDIAMSYFGSVELLLHLSSKLCCVKMSRWVILVLTAICMIGCAECRYQNTKGKEYAVSSFAFYTSLTQSALYSRKIALKRAFIILLFRGVIASWKLESKCMRLLWTEYWYSKLFRLLWKFLHTLMYGFDLRICGNENPTKTWSGFIK